MKELNNQSLQQNFMIGDQWLYYKIYTGVKTGDAVLTKIIKPVVIKLLKKKIIDKWFFIRYSDPDFHIRVRFRCLSPENIAQIINGLFDPLKSYLELDLIWKVQLDTYQRELKRYGMNTIDLSETIFYHDSEMAVNLLDLLDEEEGEELRWLFAIKAIDSFLDLFCPSIELKQQQVNYLKMNFDKEFGMNKPLTKQMNDKFRVYRKKIESFMELDEINAGELLPLIDLLMQNQTIIKSCAERLLEIEKKGNLQVPLPNLIGSYLHMQLNRLFKSKNRLHEMVCYNLLYRYYHSKIGRKVHSLK